MKKDLIKHGENFRVDSYTVFASPQENALQLLLLL